MPVVPKIMCFLMLATGIASGMGLVYIAFANVHPNMLSMAPVLAAIAWTFTFAPIGFLRGWFA